MTDTSTAKLEPKTLELFLYLAGEAPDWDWTPPIEGLMPFSNEVERRLMQLMKHDLLWVEAVDNDNHQIHFTDTGIDLAKLYGVELR
jgi:hypothetical protein